MESHSLSPSACLLGSLVFSLMFLDVRSSPTPHLSLVTPFSVYCGSLHPFFLCSFAFVVLQWTSGFFTPASFQSSAHSCFCMLSVIGSFMLPHASIRLFLCSLILYSLAHSSARCLSPLSVCSVRGDSLLYSVLRDSVCCDHKLPRGMLWEVQLFQFPPLLFLLSALSLSPSLPLSFFLSFILCVYIWVSGCHAMCVLGDLKRTT